jgi:hypothetical protein
MIERGLMGFIDDARKAVQDRKVEAVTKAGDAYAADVQKVAPVDTGFYRSRIRSEVTAGDSPVARIGSPVKYMHRLEFGFHGADRLGRNYNQAERVHWRSMWYVHLEEYKNIINRIIMQDVHLK